MSTSGTATTKTLPSGLRWARILAIVSVVRLAGIALITAPSGVLPAYFTGPFGAGDTLTGLIAIPVAYGLDRGGLRTYALGVGWCIFGLTDGFLGLSVTSAGGILDTVGSFVGPSIVLLPIALATELAVLVLLLTKSVRLHFAGRG